MRILKTNILAEGLYFLESPRWYSRLSNRAGCVETTHVEIGGWSAP
jgi:hypothetical protein